MPEIESRRFPATIAADDGRELGEARLWVAGTRDAEGRWTGWLHVADLGGTPPPGLYRARSDQGWEAAFEVTARPTTRVFETELLLISGTGPLPWPPPADRDDPHADEPLPAPGTPHFTGPLPEEGVPAREP